MKKLTILLVLLIFGSSVFSQSKKQLTFDDILKWNRITETVISNDGNTIVYKSEPWKGDPVLYITDKKGAQLLKINSAFGAKISADSKFVVFTIKSTEAAIKELKLKKTKKDKLPLSKLGIYYIDSGLLDTINDMKSHKLPKKWAGWTAYQIKTEVKKDTSKKELDKKEKKAKKESKKNGYALVVHNLNLNTSINIPFVTDYYFAEEKEVLTYVTTGDDKEFKAGVYHYDLNSQKQTELLIGEGSYKSVTANKTGTLVAFLADTTDSKIKSYAMYLWDGNGLAQEIVNNSNTSIPKYWELSPNGKISFSESNSRVFFGTHKIKPEKDTTILDEEIAKLDVWHWNEPILHSEQLNSKDRDLKKSYLAVYHIDVKKMVQLETTEFTGVSLINKGDSDKVLAWSNLSYAVQTMWEGSPYHNDFYLIDINTGNVKKIKQNCRAYPQVSPEGKYLYWYNAIDTSWNTYNILSGKEFKITNPKTVQVANELNDIPNPPRSYRMAGWLIKDEALLIYDRFDIWKVDPENMYEPINLTVNGKQTKTSYRAISFKDRFDDEKGIDPDDIMYLKGHNEITRNEGYYKMSIKKASSPKELLSGSFNLNNPKKAKDADILVYTKENFQLFPNLNVTENDFKKSNLISDVNPQQKDFLWGTKELYSWTSLDGRKLEGLLIKPENFDPNKKYPMIVNFYEKSSQGLYRHQIPEAHRSTVDYHYYSSNGYLIFNPDIYYKEGYPGEDAFNCVMPGVTQLISEGFVDENSIAAQGHSWGGYQVAYLATRTNLFAAIESGAPVVNMFSAYGGIRLWTGLNRSFQYEHTQSRIGKSIWESPLRYLENSPIFTVDKIQTPMLIMHNTDDGAVPFSQGIEFFIALRRLKKEAWLLNYNEADHWPTKVRDKYDFQIRLAQFFDHYLKGEPMPKWMKEGIPAVDKNYNMGFELQE